MVKADGKAVRGRPRKAVTMDRTVRVRMEPELLERVSAAARAQGVTRSQWLRLALAVVFDSPGDLARAVAVDPAAERTQLVARSRSRAGKGVGDGSPA